MCWIINDRYDFRRVELPEPLATLFFITRVEGLVEQTFYDGSVTCEQDFVELMEDAHCFGVYLDNKIVGFTWLNGWMGRSAAAHVCMWPGAGKHTVPMGRDFLRYALTAQDDTGYYRDSLIGLTPATHRHAVIFSKWIGFKHAATLPHAAVVNGKTTDLVVSTVTRQDLGLED